MMADARLLPDVEQVKAFVFEAFEELGGRIPIAQRRPSRNWSVPPNASA